MTCDQSRAPSNWMPYMMYDILYGKCAISCFRLISHGKCAVLTRSHRLIAQLVKSLQSVKYISLIFPFIEDAHSPRCISLGVCWYTCGKQLLYVVVCRLPSKSLGLGLKDVIGVHWVHWASRGSIGRHGRHGREKNCKLIL